MTRIPASIFPSASTLNILPNVASTRTVRQSQGSLIVTDVCQDPQDPTKVIIGFSLTNINTQNLLVEILDVDGDSSYGSNGTTATIYTSDIRTYQFPVRASSGAISGKVVANFGAAISNFLEKFIIEFRLSAVAPDGSIAASDLYTWRKTVLPRPVGINYLDGVLQVQFQYDGTTDCSCSVQCVAPTGVFETLTFCPDQRQTINVNALLEGDPFNFSILVSDALGNTSSLAVNAISNVKPYPLTVSVDQKDIHDAPIVRVNLNLININGIAIPYKYYQIIKFDRTQNNYYIWKDWTSDPETVVFDYSIRSNETYGYAVRYKGEFGDVSSFSEWTTINTAFQYEDYTPPEVQDYVARFGSFVDAFDHDSQETNAATVYRDTTFISSIDFGANINTPGEYFPERFKAVHMSVIPKGKYRGRLVVWDSKIVIGTDEKLYPGETIAFQPWSIIDPSKNPADKKFLNFLLPLGVVEEAPRTLSSSEVMYPNLFCAGHTWTQNGDLLVAGGAYFTETQDQYAFEKTFIWNPSASFSSYFFVTPSGTSAHNKLTGDHYTEGNGIWTQGPSLSIRRYYPTVTLSPSIYRDSIGDKVPMCLVFGGSTPGYYDPFLPYAYGDYTGYNSYEALSITGNPTERDCGFSKDVYDGKTIFSGPGRIATNGFQEDTFYFYPRMSVLSNGKVFMAGMSPKSATLVNHETDPGKWEYTAGHEYEKNTLNAFRGYTNTAYFGKIGNKLDYILRIGGGSDFLPPPAVYFEYFNATGWENSSVESIQPTSAEAKWVTMPHMSRPRNLSTATTLPDGSVWVNGGGQIIVRNRITNNIIPWPFRRPGAGTSRLAPPDNYINPWDITDHHHHGEGTATWDDFYDSLPQDGADFQRMVGDPPTLGEEEGVRVGNLVFHYTPETYFVDKNKWISQPWSPGKTIRQYHATSVVLPDGRVFVGGGEGRELFSGKDYEVYEPHYLRPSVDNPDLIPVRPSGVVITDATINPDPNHNAYDLNYDTPYTIQVSDNLLPKALAKVVLMSPCSASHHFDMAQRYTECSTTVVNNLSIQFTTPGSDYVWQKGFHMLFVVDNEGIPSEAIWVKF